MDSITLCRLACSDSMIRKKFGGVYASDELPLKTNGYKSFIVNLDPKTKPGSHWIALAFKNCKCYYFCSYASFPQKNILNFMKRNSKSYEWNRNHFQSLDSYTCGHFCLFFLYKFVRNHSLKPLNSNKIKNNEIFIKRFITLKFKLHNCCFLPQSTQSCEAYNFKNQEKLK